MPRLPKIHAALQRFRAVNPRKTDQAMAIIRQFRTRHFRRF